MSKKSAAFAAFCACIFIILFTLVLTAVLVPQIQTPRYNAQTYKHGLVFPAWGQETGGTGETGETGGTGGTGEVGGTGGATIAIYETEQVDTASVYETIAAEIAAIYEAIFGSAP